MATTFKSTKPGQSTRHTPASPPHHARRKPSFRRLSRSTPSCPKRLASNFVALSVAEIICRATSVAVTLCLAQRLGTAGFGRIEFAFNLVTWLVLLVREGLDVLAAREIA